MIMHAQRAPIAIAKELSGEVVNSHASGVEPQPHAQRFEGALLRAPKQGEKLEAVRWGGLHQQLLFFSSEVVGGEGIAARLDDFEIATQCRLGLRDGASRPTRAVADRDGNGRGSISEEDFRSAARSRANCYAREGPGIGRQVQVGGHRALCRPAAHPPVGAALGESHATEADRFASAQPIVLSGHIRDSLFQPGDLYQAAPTACSALNGSASTGSGCATIL